MIIRSILLSIAVIIALGATNFSTPSQIPDSKLDMSSVIALETQETASVAEVECELSQVNYVFNDTIECIELSELIESNYPFTLIDARELSEWQTGYIKGAVLIPYKQISDNLSLLPKEKDSLIVVYCKSGVRSSIAQKTLKELGYTNVINLIQGITGWTFEKYPVIIP